MAAKSGVFRTARDEKTKQGTPAVRPATAAASSLDRLIHERTRLAIVSALAVNASLAFNELKQLLRVTDGNLSVQDVYKRQPKRGPIHRGTRGDLGDQCSRGHRQRIVTPRF